MKSVDLAARIDTQLRGRLQEPGDLASLHPPLPRDFPHSWQRFEPGRPSFSVESALASGGQRRGLLRRLFRRG